MAKAEQEGRVVCHKEMGAALRGEYIEAQWMQEVKEVWWEAQGGKLDIKTRWALEVVERQGKPRYCNQMHAVSCWEAHETA